MSKKIMTEAEDAAFAALWAKGTPYPELQAIFGLASPSSVTSVSRRLDLTRRSKTDRPAKAEKPAAPDPRLRVPAMPPHPFWTPERDLSVLATAGRYPAIEALAKTLGRRRDAVLQRWHQLRAA